jgi:hypothetical protein
VKIFVLVKPSTKSDIVKQIDEAHFNIRVKEQAIDGKANKAVIKLLSKHFDVAKKQINIISGLNSKHKKIDIIR